MKFVGLKIGDAVAGNIKSWKPIHEVESVSTHELEPKVYSNTLEITFDTKVENMHIFSPEDVLNSGIIVHSYDFGIEPNDSLDIQKAEITYLPRRKVVSIVEDIMEECFDKERDVYKKRIAELESQLKEGNEDGSRCNRRCEGVMVLGQSADCTCHISPPCNWCIDSRPVCSMCDWEVE